MLEGPVKHEKKVLYISPDILRKNNHDEISKAYDNEFAKVLKKHGIKGKKSKYFLEGGFIEKKFTTVESLYIMKAKTIGKTCTEEYCLDH